MPPKNSSSPLLRDTLPSSTIIPPSALLRRFLTRLPKSVLIDLVLIWLDHPLCPIPEPDEDLYMQDAETLDDKKAIYAEYRDENAASKSVVIDKILMNDWRNGLNVLQVAMLDMQHLFHAEKAQKWLSSELHFATPPAKTSIQTRPMPSLRPTSLVTQLRKSINPLMRNSHPTLSLLIIRLVLTDGGVKEDLLSPRRTFFLAIPSSSPYVFHTPAADQLQELIRQTLSQVFSTARYPVIVTPTKPAITAKTLETMISLCGAGRETSALGAWRVYAKGWVDGSPLAPETIAEDAPAATDERSVRETIARARFGLRPRKGNVLAVNQDEEDEIVLPALERVEWRITHDYPDESPPPFAPSMTMRLDGVNVFHGVYEGIIEGWIDGDRVPGWLTGEEGRSEGKVLDGRIVDL